MKFSDKIGNRCPREMYHPNLRPDFETVKIVALGMLVFSDSPDL